MLVKQNAQISLKQVSLLRVLLPCERTLINVFIELYIHLKICIMFHTHLSLEKSKIAAFSVTRLPAHLFKFWQFGNNENLPNSKNIVKVGSKFAKY